MKRRRFSVETFRQWIAVLVLGLFGLGIIRPARELEMWHLHVEGGAEPTVTAPYSVYGNTSPNILTYSWNGPQTSLTPQSTPWPDATL